MGHVLGHVLGNRQGYSVGHVGLGGVPTASEPEAITLSAGVIDSSAVVIAATGLTLVSAIQQALIDAGMSSDMVVFVDFGEVASGSFTNYGSGGGTMSAVGSPTYNVTFPAPVGGKCVQFPVVGADGFILSSTSVGNVGASTPMACMAIFKADSESNTGTLIDKRDVTTTNGYFLRINATDIFSGGVRDGALTTANPSGDVADAVASYGAMRYDAGSGVYGWHDGSASETFTSKGTANDMSASAAVSVGFGSVPAGRTAFGTGTGLLRAIAIWVGAGALSVTKSNMDTFWADIT